MTTYKHMCTYIHTYTRIGVHNNHICICTHMCEHLRMHNTNAPTPTYTHLQKMRPIMDMLTPKLQIIRPLVPLHLHQLQPESGCAPHRSRARAPGRPGWQPWQPGSSLELGGPPHHWPPDLAKCLASAAWLSPAPARQAALAKELAEPAALACPLPLPRRPAGCAMPRPIAGTRFGLWRTPS